MKIKLLGKNEFELWDRFVASSSNGTIFNKSFWLNSSGAPFDIWGAFQGDNLVGGFVVSYRKLLSRKIAAPPHLTPYSGIVFPNYKGKYVGKITSEKELIKEAAELIRKEYGMGVLSFDPSAVDLQPFLWQGYKVRLHYTYILNISSLGEAWKNMAAEKRNDIRKAENDGLKVRASNSFDELILLVKKTFNRQGLEPSWEGIAGNYYRTLSDRSLCKGFVCIDGKGTSIAAALIIWDEKRAYYLLGGYDGGAKHHGASSLCLWAAIKYAAEELGIKVFDFEGSSIPQVERSFRKFGGTLTPYYEVRWGRMLDTVLMLNRIFKKAW